MSVEPDSASTRSASRLLVLTCSQEADKNESNYRALVTPRKRTGPRHTWRPVCFRVRCDVISEHNMHAKARVLSGATREQRESRDHSSGCAHADTLSVRAHTHKRGFPLAPRDTQDRLPCGALDLHLHHACVGSRPWRSRMHLLPTPPPRHRSCGGCGVCTVIRHPACGLRRGSCLIDNREISSSMRPG